MIHRPEHMDHLGRHEGQLNVLARIGRLLATQAGQREMLNEVLLELESGLEMRHSTVMLLSPDGNELIVEAVRGGMSDSQRGARYVRGEGVTGNVLHTGRPAIVPHVAAEPAFQSRVHLRQDQDVSFICVPVRLGNEVIGTLSADMKYTDDAMLVDNRRVLELIASLIAFDVKSRRRAKLERANLEAENRRLQTELAEQYRPENIIGNSNAMRDVYRRIQQVAGSETTVLIRGESGTGKELVASAIHYNSPRADKPFIKVNCAALSETLLESELFGHEKGAFTGAIGTRTGHIEAASGGTLFLDEIGDFSPAVQIKLLRVLQEREFQRVGGSESIKADVRIVTATNADLEAKIEKNLFRQDLYYRINVFPIFLPALRERKDDILLLADHFIQKYSKSMGKPIKRISTSAIDMMVAYHWPGNVRELENCIEHAILLCEGDVISAGNMPPTLQMPDGTRPMNPTSLPARVEIIEREMLTDALKCTRGNIAAAARRVGITPRMARYKIRKLGIDT